ncbi:MAG: outer membrane lipoprotein carrier protein LolA, partial [Acidobacteria bacterium]|nr:outer membrane lipoprotein carrier protein LolA [Acidobacteriota bacterium]
MNRFCQVATLVLMMSGMPIAQAPDELIARLQQKYEALESFSADFGQMFQGGGVQLRESGIVKMKKPGKMYWEYQQPTPKIFIADG